MIEKLLEVGFLTGSRAFGTEKKDSDYDIVYSIEDTEEINDIIGESKRTQSDYFSGYYIKDGDKQINLIPVHPHEFLPWYLATKAMKETLKQSGILDPIRKYSVFMGIVSLFKGTVEQRKDLGHYQRVKKEILQGF